MNQITETAASIGLAIVGLAILAVLVSRRSNTPGVVSSIGNAFSQAIGTAVSPVTGARIGSPTSGIGDFYSGGVPLY